MAAARPKRDTKEVDYALFNNTGRKKMDSEMEDGQLAESPFDLHGNDQGEFMTGSHQSDMTDTEQDEVLDQTLTHRSDTEPQKLEEEQSLLSMNDHELIQDEVWEQQQKILQENKHRREMAKLKLLRKKELNEALLREEEERRALAEMEREVSQLENRRSVKLRVINDEHLNMAYPGDNSTGKHKHDKHDRHGRCVSYADQYDLYEAEHRGASMNVAPKNPMTGEEKINKWLANSEEVEFFHETRSEPGNTKFSGANREQLNETYNIHFSRHALQKERKNYEKPVEYEPLGEHRESGARPKSRTVVAKKRATHRGKPRQHQPQYRHKVDDGESEFSLETAGAYRGNDSERDYNRQIRDDKVKSGFLDKPRSQVITKQKWPHMNQNPRYVTSPLTFNQLNFCQFVGGEVRTVLRAEDWDEITGRLRMLSKIAYLYDQCRDWERARNVYFTIVSSIEEGESIWDNSFGHYDIMCPPKQEEGGAHYRFDNKTQQAKTKPKKEFYCKEFQKGECDMTSPHRSWIRNNYEMVEHFCFPCFKVRLGKLNHSPVAENCPNKK